jgi:hypothetical protein
LATNNTSIAILRCTIKAMRRFEARGTMTSAMAAFGIAVGATSLFFYLLMTRLEKHRANLKSQGDSPSADGGNYARSDGWSMSSWFGGVHSASDSSGNPSDSGGSDSGGGGDGGGGGD